MLLIFLVLQKRITNLFELESVGHGANLRVEEVRTMHVEQPLVVVHPHLDEKREFISHEFINRDHTSTVRAVLIPWVSLFPGNV